jgi:tetratricopeptide (TPR) repeat protein
MYRFLHLAAFSVLLTLPVAANGDISATVAELEAKGDTSRRDFDNVGAMGWYQKAYSRDKDNPVLVGKLAQACVDVAEDINSAKESPVYLRRAIEYAEYLKRLSPEEEAGWLIGATARWQLGRHGNGRQRMKHLRAAASDAERVLAMASGSARAQLVLGVYYRESGELGFMRRLLGKLTGRKVPPDPFAKAEASLRQAAESAQTAAAAHFELGVTYARMKMPDKAAASFAAVGQVPIIDHRDPFLRRAATRMLAKIEE